MGPPPQLGHRSRIARQNSRAIRRRNRHMAEVYAELGVATMLDLPCGDYGARAFSAAPAHAYPERMLYRGRRRVRR